LRVALSDGITPSRLPTLLALCRQEEPEVEIRFFEVPLSRQLKGLQDDLYDLGFAQSDEVGDGIMRTVSKLNGFFRSFDQVTRWGGDGAPRDT
jgi:DNA-binding transcriptional LysR family regulator